MNFKEYLDYRLLRLIGPIILIISEFAPWYSGLSLLNIFFITTSVRIEDSFLYLFPLVSGIICLFASILIIYNNKFRIKSVVINFIGLGFQFLFFLELIPSDYFFLLNAEFGFYLCISGFIIIIFNILIALIIVREE